MTRKIWVDARDIMVKRCSFCGKYRNAVKEHWFFKGVYCVSCIQDVLWDNARTMEEMT